MSAALVILAAGTSKRFGADKRRYLIDGEPMLLRCLKLYAAPALCSRFSERILVLSGETEPFDKMAAELGYRVICNETPELGISGSIRLGTAAARAAKPEGILYSVADQPHLSEATVRAILDAFERDRTCIAAPIANGKRGNPVLFPSDLLTKLEQLEGDCGGSVVIRQHGDRLTLVETEARELEDIDWKTEETE